MSEIKVTVTQGNPITVQPVQKTVQATIGVSRKEVHKIKKFTSDGVTKIIILDGYIFRSNSLIIFLNGVLQEKDTSYTEAEDRKSITFTTAPKSGWKGEIRYVVD